MSKSKITFGKAFKTIIWPRKKLLIVGLFLIIISRASGLVTPIIMKPFVNNALGKDMNLTFQIVGIVIFSVFITYKINSKFKQFELDWYNLTCFCLIIFQAQNLKMN